MRKRTFRPTIIYAVLVSLPYFLMAMLGMMLMIGFSKVTGYGGYVVPLSLLYFFYRVLLVRSRKLVVTDELVVYKRGVFSKREDLLEMYRIKDYSVSKPFHYRLIGTMIVTLVTSDRINPVLRIKGVPINDFVYRLRELVEIQRGRKRVFEVD